MKKSILMSMLFMGGLVCGVNAQNQPIEKANYALAERYSSPKVGKMVYSTGVKPTWLKSGNAFWYRYTTSAGSAYYFVDCLKTKKTPLFDHVKMAQELSTITGDPFVSTNLNLSNLKFDENGKSFRFEYVGKTQADKKLSKAERKKEEEKKAKEGDKYKEPKPTKENKRFYFNYDMSNGKLTELTDIDPEDERGYPGWASVSPDGNTIIFSKNYNLYTMDRENFDKALIDAKDSTIVEKQITFDGEDGFCYGAGSDYLLDTQLKDFPTKRNPSYITWSPDSKHFALMRTDARKIRKFWVINSIDAPRPTLQSYRYHMAGEKDAAQQSLYVFAVDSMKPKTVDISNYKDQSAGIIGRQGKIADSYNRYNPRIWMGDNDFFYINRTSRDHHRQDFAKVNFALDTVILVSNTEMNVPLEERGLTPVNGGKEYIIRSERDGWAHFYLYDNEGSVKNQITKGEYHSDQLVGIDEKARVMYFTAKGVVEGQNPYYEHLCRINFDGTGLKVLNEGDYNFSSAMNDHNTYFVSNFSRVNTAPQSALYNNKGKKVLDLETSDMSSLLASGYKYPEIFQVKAADGITDLYGVMYKPYDFDSTKLYPVIAYVYPGPQTEAVNESFSRGMTRVDRLAQMGFVVVTVGNRGGHSVRSKWYHTFGYGNLRDYGLADKKYAIEQLASQHDYIDINKVGIHGHSGGGFMSTAAMFVYPDFFKVAVSCAGNHDNNIYNRWWSEKHHGIKEIVNEKDTTFEYRIATNPQAAANLKGKLLLIHGEIDENVHMANTMRVANALIKSNKRFDMIILPTQRHSFGDMDEYFFWRMADYFSEHLIGDSKIREVHIPELSQ
ncbi:MAG: DPP IV N-terminal domain-containing protein [Marinifilaceae bacterium]